MLFDGSQEPEIYQDTCPVVQFLLSFHSLEHLNLLVSNFTTRGDYPMGFRVLGLFLSLRQSLYI